MQLNSRVVAAKWVEDQGICEYTPGKICLVKKCPIRHKLTGEIDEVEIDSDGKIMKDWCHVLVNGTGFLNNWKCRFFPNLSDPYFILQFRRA